MVEIPNATPQEELPKVCQQHRHFDERFVWSRSLLHFAACRVVGDPKRAELAVQNCWRRTASNPPRFGHDGAFRSWLLRILINEALAIRRSATFLNTSSGRGHAAGSDSIPNLTPIRS